MTCWIRICISNTYPDTGGDLNTDPPGSETLPAIKKILEKWIGSLPDLPEENCGEPVAKVSPPHHRRDLHGGGQLLQEAGGCRQAGRSKFVYLVD